MVPASPRHRTALIAITVGVLVVATVIVAAAVLTPHDPPQVAHVASAGAPIDVGAVVPTPVIDKAVLSPDGTSATFTWTNPDPAKGDSYVWQRTDGAAQGGATPTTVGKAVISGVSPGTVVCVQVSIDRAGELSPAPLKACTS